MDNSLHYGIDNVQEIGLKFCVSVPAMIPRPENLGYLSIWYSSRRFKRFGYSADRTNSAWYFYIDHCRN